MRKYTKIHKKILTSKCPSYNTISRIIIEASANIKPIIPSALDGRISSALAEQQYLTNLRKHVIAINPAIKCVIPQKRAWCDIFIADIPINLKITNGGTDNAFNKNAIHYTLFGKTIPTTSFQAWSQLIRQSKIPLKRSKSKEYHYLVYHKKTNKTIFKSILDISEYKSNPSNIIQINWNREFGSNFAIKNSEHIAKKLELLRAVQQSVKIAAKQMNEISMIDLSALL